MRATTAALLTALAAAVAPAGASAATVTRDGGALVYTAVAGMTNNVHLMAAEDGSTITFYASDGDLMSAIAEGCAQDENWPGEVVNCTPASAVRVALGDGDDRGIASDDLKVPIVIDGGAGEDDLLGNLQANTLDGGAGDDTINGGPGDDVLRGADGADDLQGKAGRDRLDGGAGNDTCTPTATRTRPRTSSTAAPVSTRSTATTPVASAAAIRRWPSRWPAAPTTAARARATTCATSSASR